MFEQFVRKKRAYTQVLRELLDAKEHSFVEPWQLTSESSSAVVQVLHNSFEDREYLVARKNPADKISATDSGQIGKLRVKMAEVNKPVFVRASTIFKRACLTVEKNTCHYSYV